MFLKNYIMPKDQIKNASKNSVSFPHGWRWQMLLYQVIITGMGAGRTGQGGALAPPPGNSKLSLLLFLSVICITYEG